MEVGQRSHKHSLADVGGIKLRTYRWRWVVLAIFSLNLCVNNWVWIMAAPIADVFRCYYGVSNFWVNAVTLSCNIVYVLFAIPAALFLDRYGLRATMMFATLTNALGTSIRVIGTGANYFCFQLIGATIASFNNLVLWGAGAFLSEIWFPVSERATSTVLATAVSSNAGILIGVGVTPLVIHRSDTVKVCGNGTHIPSPSHAQFTDWSNAIYNQMFYYLLVQAVLSVALVFATLMAFPNAPPSPPSLSRYLEKSDEHVHISTCQYLKKSFAATVQAFKNIHFVIFVLVAGIMIAMAGAAISVINEIIVPFFPGHDEEIAYIGIAVQGSAMVCMFLIGRLVDWSKAFYVLNVSTTWASLASISLLAVSIIYLHHFYILYISAVLVGVSLTAFQAVGYEYAVEMTYPLSEATSATLLNLTSQIISTTVVFIVGYLSETHPEYGLWILVAITAIAAFLSVFVKPELKRLKIDQQTASVDMKIQT